MFAFVHHRHLAAVVPRAYSNAYRTIRRSRRAVITGGGLGERLGVVPTLNVRSNPTYIPLGVLGG